MEKYELGLNKKSFSLFYNGGEIWGEHLDSLYNQKDLIKQKFKQDLVQISRPSTSSFIAVNLIVWQKPNTGLMKSIKQCVMVS